MVLAIKTPDQIEQERQQALAQRNAPVLQPADTVSQLAGFVRNYWGIAKFNRQVINQRLLDCLRRRTGEYDASKLAAIRQTNGSEIFMQVTGAKCRSAKAWLSDLFAPAGDRPFSMKPTPIPDLPPDIKQRMIAEAVSVAQQSAIPQEAIQALLLKHRDRLMDELKQEAETRAERMSDKIEDLMVEADWREEFDELLDDLVTYPAAVLKGIEFRRAKRLQWVNQQGQFVPVVGEAIVPKVRRVSPFRSYPSPAAGSKLSRHWFIEHHTFTRQDLVNMRGAPGYNAAGIAQALLHYGMGGLREWMWSETERQSLEGRSQSYTNEDIDALEWSGTVSGQQLIDWNFGQGEQLDPLDEYPVSIMIIGNYLIRAIVNPDPTGKPDYHKACWQTVPGSFWGIALPELLSDCQDTCNAAARALINNMGYASGPMVWVEVDRLAVGEDPTKIYPWRVWQSNHANSTGGPGVGFFQPQSNAQELLNIYERFSKYGDEVTGLPAYAYGSDQGAGAAKTMGGLSILMNAASKTIKAVVRNIDIGIIEPVVNKFYNFIMLTDEDQSIKGDAIARARGSDALIHKEQSAQQQLQLLAVTANPVDMAIIGPDGRREQLHELFKASSIPVDRVVPSRDELMQRQEAQAQAQMAQQNAQLTKAAA